MKTNICNQDTGAVKASELPAKHPSCPHRLLPSFAQQVKLSSAFSFKALHINMCVVSMGSSHAKTREFLENAHDGANMHAFQRFFCTKISLYFNFSILPHAFQITVVLFLSIFTTVIRVFNF